MLWAALDGAMVRDNGGASAGGTATSTEPTAVTNENVQDARGTITREADELGAEVMRRLTLRRRMLWPALLVLDQADSWHRRLTLTDDRDATAGQICDKVGRWRHLARSAVGLSLPGRDTTERCPFHRGTEPTLLHIDGDQANLDAAILAGRWPARTEPGLRWTYGTTVVCSACRRRWEGATALAALRRLLDEEDALEVDAAEPGHRDGWYDAVAMVARGAGRAELGVMFGLLDHETAALRDRVAALAAIRAGSPMRGVMSTYHLDYAEAAAMRHTLVEVPAVSPR